MTHTDTDQHVGFVELNRTECLHLPCPGQRVIGRILYTAGELPATEPVPRTAPPRRSRSVVAGHTFACQRRRSAWAAALGWRSRVNTPFLLPPTRMIPEVVAKSAKFHTCSPTTASMRSKTR